MDKKFWISTAIAGVVAIVAVKFVAEPLGRKLQTNKNATVAKAGSYLS